MGSSPLGQMPEQYFALRRINNDRASGSGFWRLDRSTHSHRLDPPTPGPTANVRTCHVYPFAMVCRRSGYRCCDLARVRTPAVVVHSEVSAFPATIAMTCRARSLS
jgi:hypothetical protein